MSRAVGRRWFRSSGEITPPAAQRLVDLVGQLGRPEGNWPLEVEQLQKTERVVQSILLYVVHCSNLSVLLKIAFEG